MNIETMTRDERSCLLYIECCVVDHGGLMVGARLNGDDHAAIKKFVAEGILVRGGRIPAKTLERDVTHYAELSEAGWKLVHELRRWRARPEARGPHATRVFTVLDEREATA